MTDRSRQVLLKFGLAFAIATLAGLFLTSQILLLLHASREAGPRLAAALTTEPPWVEIFEVGLAECYLWALLAPGILWLGHRFPLGTGSWGRSVALHLTACLLFAGVETCLSILVNELLRRDLPKPFSAPELIQLFSLGKLHNDVLIYWLILGTSQGLAYYRKYRDRELRASQLEAQLAQAQLQVLKMQLHPHFLFNTLHAISALLHEDVEVADRMIARLGELLRATLERADLQEVSLRQEIDFIRPYLEIEQARMGERLTVELAIDPEVLDACVPNLLLQPLVENAIRHGIAPRTEPGHLEIRARREAARLCLQVCDDGPGLPIVEKARPKEGVGVSNTRARLRQLYGDAHGFTLRNRASGGLVVEVTIPFRPLGVNGGVHPREVPGGIADLDCG